MSLATDFVRAAYSVVDRANARHPWSHNDHFHRWILQRLPVARGRALDVGCGRGELAAALAARFGSVDAADSDATMRAATAGRCAGLPVQTLDGFEAARGPYDAITLVASLHHLALDAALPRCADLLAPRGRLLVVGMVRPVGLRDGAWFVVSALANPLIGFAKRPRRYRGPARPAPFPVRDPDESFADIAAAARRHLPGARLRRRVPFRYTLEWTAGPAAPSDRNGRRRG